MSLEVTLFISHAWDKRQHYDQLVGLLNSIAQMVWHDISITEDKAIILASGDEEAPQKRQFLIEREQALGISLRDVRVELARLRDDLARVRKDYLELDEFRSIDTRIRRAYEKIAQTGFVTTIRSLERQKAEFALKYRGVDVDLATKDSEEKLSRLTDVIAPLTAEEGRLERELNGCARSLEKLNGALRVGKVDDPRNDLFKRFPNLALGIHNRIGLADAVLSIAYANSAYRTWHEFEYQTSFVLGKPILGLVRDDVISDLPPDLKRFGVLPVRWDPNEVLKALDGSLRRHRPNTAINQAVGPDFNL